ncbi:MAG: aldehyde ferredoxin oxidoreductase family protein [Anaerolineaceae bacterium]
MYECYNRKLLRINLTDRTSKEEPISEKMIQRWVGGMGFGVKLLTHEVPPTTDAFSPDNKIYICVGPLTGTIAPLFAQTCIITKSPLTTGVINTYAGGQLATAIKSAGYDVIVFEGKADELVYLTLTPGGIKFINCPELKGKPVREAEEYVKTASGCEDMHTVGIGLAGENLIRYAAAISETRAFGRGGAGAVFGSKNLKVFGVAGIRDIKVSDPEGFEGAVERTIAAFKEDLSHPWSLLGGFGRIGTGSGVALINDKHVFATRYHKYTSFEHAHEIDGEAFMQKYETHPIGCQSCLVHCGMIRKPAETKWGTIWTRGPEYETMYSIGSLCFNGDSDMLYYANDQAEKYGMDTLSLGVNVAFAMECVDRGILSKDALGEGYILEFGNPDATVRLIDMIAAREGIGDLLAEGVKRASEKLGRGTQDFALQVKGMEFAAWMPERMRGVATTFATANRGACHKRAPIGMELMEFVPMDSTEGRAELVAHIQNVVNATFTLVSCRFAEFVLKPAQFADLLNNASGMNFTAEQFEQMGEAIWNMERMYNLAAGIDATQDSLPEICFKVPLDFPEGYKPLTHSDFDILIKDYYEYRGWDANGTPTPEQLEKLGLKV